MKSTRFTVKSMTKVRDSEGKGVRDCSCITGRRYVRNLARRIVW